MLRVLSLKAGKPGGKILVLQRKIVSAKPPFRTSEVPDLQPEGRKKLILPTHVDWGGDQGMICANCLHIKPRENPQPARYAWAFIPSSSLAATGSWGFSPAMLDFCRRDGLETRTDSSCPWYEQRTLAAIKKKIKAGKSARRRRKRLKKAEAVSGHQKIPTVDAAPLLTTPDTILGGA